MIHLVSTRNTGCREGLLAPNFDQVRHMFKSLRSTLILPWLLIAIVCCALAFQLRGLFDLGIGGEIGKVDQSVKLSAEQIKQQLDLYLTGFSEASSTFANSDRQHELLLRLIRLKQKFTVFQFFPIPQLDKTLITSTIGVLTLIGIMTRPFRWNEAVIAMAGAGVLLVLGLISPSDAFFTLGRDWNIFLFFLV
jgi:hypothetical protein